MANEVTHRPATDVAMPAEKNAFERYSESGARSIVGEILKFNKSEWVHGRENEEMPEGVKLIAGTHLIEVGWILWLDGRPMDTVMGRLADAYVPPRRSELGQTNSLEWPRSEMDSDYGKPRDPWQPQNCMPMVDQNGVVYTFVTGSKGGIMELKRLAGIYGKRMRQHPDEVPVVTLSASSYRHPNKRLGKVWTPVFEIAGWTGKKRLHNAILKAEQLANEEPEEDENFGREVEGAKPKPQPKPSPHKDYQAERPSWRAKPAPAPAEPAYAGEGDDDIPF